MKNIDLKNQNVFNLIGEKWMLVAAADKQGKSNAMTASWGGMGILWGKKVAFVFIRPQRYTRNFVDEAENFSLSFFGEEYRKMLSYMGRVSGRDKDKIKNSGLTLKIVDGSPVFQEAEMTLICKKLYRQTIDDNCFIDKSIIQGCYPEKDYHDVYVAEIIKQID